MKNKQQIKTNNLTESKKINLTPHYTVTLPVIFKELTNQIEASISLLNLKDNWDEEGSEGYRESTLIKSVDFLTKYALWIWEMMEIVIDTPKFLPGPNGSIDLFWEKDNYDLLINIPVPPNNIAGFYGDNKKDTQIEGKFNLKSYNQGIFLCLLNQK